MPAFRRNHENRDSGDNVLHREAHWLSIHHSLDLHGSSTSSSVGPLYHAILSLCEARCRLPVQRAAQSGYPDYPALPGKGQIIFTNTGERLFTVITRSILLIATTRCLIPNSVEKNCDDGFDRARLYGHRSVRSQFTCRCASRHIAGVLLVPWGSAIINLRFSVEK